MARPSEFSQETADMICSGLAEGKSLRTVCKAAGMPSTQTVFCWIRSIPEFHDQYARAKDESADMHAEDMLDIADDGSNDWMASNDPDNPGFKLNGEHINRSRLRVDTRKWIAAKLKPKKYGDKSTTELTGPGGKDLIPEVTDIEAARRMAFILAKGMRAVEGEK